jgi:hypothetical protein
MKRQHWFALLALTTGVLTGLAGRANAQYAVEVISYDQGTTPTLVWPTTDPYNIASAALGEPERTTGEGTDYPSVVSLFSPPYLRNEVVSVGEQGWLTLRLSNYAVPQTGGPEIGLFTNAALADQAWPSGQATSPASAFGADWAEVEVSEYGHSWISLGNVLFDLPTNAYTDLTDPYASSAGGILADFQQPFMGTLSDFDGLPYDDAGGNSLLDLLAGSGGGTWLDISSTGLAKVGYIRILVADDDDQQINLNFELDAVSIATGAMGTATIPEPTAAALAALAGLLLAAGSRPAESFLTRPGRARVMSHRR